MSKGQAAGSVTMEPPFPGLFWAELPILRAACSKGVADSHFSAIDWLWWKLPFLQQSKVDPALCSV